MTSKRLLPDSAYSLPLIVGLLILPGLMRGGEWQSLFNGKDLEGWTAIHDVEATVHDGHLRIVKGMGWLCSAKEYADFVLELEFRALDKNYDSGIFIRCGKEGKPWPTDGWQVNLKYNMLGGLVKGYSPKVPADAPQVAANEWAKMRIEVVGKKISLQVNGERCWESELLDVEKGFIGIQIEDRVFDFRNIRIQER